MKASFIKRVFLSAILVLVVNSLVTTNLYADLKFYGIYSNMQAVEGEFSGFEFFIVPSNDGDFLIFQEAEGWPEKPLILRVQIGGKTTSDNNLVRFTHPTMGPFEGKIEGERLIGEFSAMKYKIELTKGKSIWQ